MSWKHWTEPLPHVAWVKCENCVLCWVSSIVCLLPCPAPAFSPLFWIFDFHYWFQGSTWWCAPRMLRNMGATTSGNPIILFFHIYRAERAKRALARSITYQPDKYKCSLSAQHRDKTFSPYLAKLNHTPAHNYSFWKALPTLSTWCLVILQYISTFSMNSNK